MIADSRGAEPAGERAVPQQAQGTHRVVHGCVRARGPAVGGHAIAQHRRSEPALR